MDGNLIVQQLEKCALEYGCRAAQNYFIGRHEAPIPTSVACNSKCIGCISLQPDGEFRASHDRIRRAPTPDEIADMAAGHIARVPNGVVSFGQGCEGEPLLGRELLPAAVRPPMWRRIALVAMSLFYGAFVALWLGGLF